MPDVTPPGGGLDQSDILSDGTPFAGSDVGETLSELQQGRTRELLFLLQDKSVPEVQDPLNIQTGLSENYEVGGNGDYNIVGDSTIDDFEDGNITIEASDWSGWNGDTSLFSAQSSTVLSGTQSGRMSINNQSADIVAQRDTTKQLNGISFETRIDNINGRDPLIVYARDSSGNRGPSVVFAEGGDIEDGRQNVLTTFSLDTTYLVEMRDIDYLNNTFDLYIDGSHEGQGQFQDSNADTVDNILFRTNIRNEQLRVYIDNLTSLTAERLAHVTDSFSASTTSPTEFKQWESIQAQGVTTGGSTSANPVEFEILNSSDTVLNSSKIPRSLMDNTEFKLRDRVYSEDAGSNGQSDYTISTTGSGGHFGINILTVVSVKQNGSVLDLANWSFDGSDTVTIDTSNVTINSGDTIEIKYDFDISGSTLKPRAYLNREATGETSPSISHFRYEYVPTRSKGVDWASKTPKHTDSFEGTNGNEFLSVSGSGYVISIQCSNDFAETDAFDLDIDGEGVIKNTEYQAAGMSPPGNLSLFHRFDSSFTLRNQSGNFGLMGVTYVLD